jgi:hypothetical protein
MPQDFDQHRTGPNQPPIVARLPVVVTPRTAGSMARILPGAGFLSQLIAARERLPVQRQRRRASVAVAISSYGATREQAVRRLPPGYGRTLVV